MGFLDFLRSKKVKEPAKEPPAVKEIIIPRLVVGAREETPSPPQPDPTPELKPIGNADPICPYCGKALAKMPGRKKKCPHCGEFIFVRTRPIDGESVLVTKDQVELIAEQWAIKNGTHKEYLEGRAIFDEARKSLEKEYGFKPPENDVKWRVLSQQQLDYVEKGNWGMYQCTLFQMAEILREEGKLKNALGTYLEAFYIDLNGPVNLEGSKDYPPFRPERSTIGPGVVNRICQIIETLGISEAEVKGLLKERVETACRFIKPAMPVDVAMEKLREASAERAKVIEDIERQKEERRMWSRRPRRSGPK